MKKISSLLVLFLIAILYSCSSDDSDSGSSTTFSTPLTIGNYWTYDVESQTGISRDSLFIDSENTINNNIYKVFI